jgi:hypothetical protein
MVAIKRRWAKRVNQSTNAEVGKPHQHSGRSNAGNEPIGLPEWQNEAQRNKFWEYHHMSGISAA